MTSQFLLDKEADSVYVVELDVTILKGSQTSSSYYGLSW